MKAMTLQSAFSSRIWLVPVALIGFLLLSIFSFNPLAGVAVMMGLGLVAFSLQRSELATLAVIFAIYMNIPAVAVRYHHVPKIVGASLGLLLFIPLIDRLIVRGEKVICDRVFVLMLLYLLVMLTSTIFARDFVLAARSMADYAFEGLVLYFLISNVVRDLPTLKRVIGAMLLAGSLMGALTIFQKATGTLNNDYGGFAQAGGVFAVGQSWGKLALQIRPNGPIGEQNRFGQLLIVLVPLASLVVLRGKTFAARAGALTAGTLIVGGVVLTYSRGAFLGLIFMITLMVFMGYIKPSRAIPVGFIAVVAFLFTGPGFIKRLQTFEQVPALLSGKSTTGQSPDESMRRRLAENLAALEVLADHPLVGVGPAHFARFYSTAYVNRIGLAAQAKGYFAHNLYLEIAANTGLLGLAAFLIIVGVLMHELWSQWRRLRWSRPNAAYYSGAFFLSCAVYLMTGVFLQLAFQRYFWLLIAVASSAARAVAQDSAEPLPKEEDLSSSPEPLRTEPA